MMSKIISFALVFISSICLADSWIVQQRYYVLTNSTYNTAHRQILFEGSQDEALQLSAQTCAILYHKNTRKFNDVTPTANYPTPLFSISNITTSTTVSFSENPYILSHNQFVSKVSNFIQKYLSIDVNLFINSWTTKTFGNVVVFPELYFEQWQNQLFQQMSVTQIQAIFNTLVDIGTQISDIIPWLDEIDQNIYLWNVHEDTFTNQLTKVNNILQDNNDTLHVLNNNVYSGLVTPINKYLNSQVDYFNGDNYDLLTRYFNLKGLAPTNNSGYLEFMIQTKLADNEQDATKKLFSQEFRQTQLQAALQNETDRYNKEQLCRSLGLTEYFDGRALQDLAYPEFDTLLQFSYNTPASSNATLQAKTHRQLKDLSDVETDSRDKLDNIDHALHGPLLVNVANWPQNLFGNNVSNFLDGVSGALADGVTNFNPIYTKDDPDFFGRQVFNWRGYDTYNLDLDSVNEKSEIGVTAFEFNPTGEFFQDVPNLLAMQAAQGADLANILASIAIHVQTNAEMMASTESEMQGYKDEVESMANSALSDFQGYLGFSNQLANIQFTSTKDILSIPNGFSTFSGDWDIPEFVNIQLPTFGQTQNPSRSPQGGEDPSLAYTITINTADYRQFFQNVRYVSLTIYWSLGVMVIIFLFKLFKTFISWIPAGLTGDVPHGYTL